MKIIGNYKLNPRYSSVQGPKIRITKTNQESKIQYSFIRVKGMPGTVMSACSVNDRIESLKLHVDKHFNIILCPTRI